MEEPKNTFDRYAKLLVNFVIRALCVGAILVMGYFLYKAIRRDDTFFMIVDVMMMSYAAFVLGDSFFRNHNSDNDVD